MAVASSGLRIQYRRTGGFAGIEMAADVGADQLPAEAAGIATRLLADPESGAPTGSAPPGAADLFDYQLRLTDGDRKHSFEWSDFGVPDAVRPLLSALNQLAKPR
jgi:hypothetical protein